MEFPKEVKEKGFHINILEMLTVLVGVRLWAKLFSNNRIQIYCDNEVTVHMLNSGKGRDHVLLKILREILFACALENIQIRAIHLPGVTNRLADQLSRAPCDDSINLEKILDSSWNNCIVGSELFSIEENW